MPERGQTIKNSIILETIETLQSKLDISLAPIATLTNDITKIKQDIRNLQEANSKANTFIQQNNSKITKQLESIENEINVIKESSFILKDDFEEFK